MAVGTRNADLLRDVRTLFDIGVIADSSDRQLLDRFLTADHAEAAAAFTLLVERHGPMVLCVCRQILGNSHDAHDAFQATFLVLLRRAGSIRKRDSLASWLFGVAVRVAQRARYAAISRRFHEQQAAALADERALAADENGDQIALLHEEIARLPERYRAPIVLCHLEGLSTAIAAQRMGCAHGTILSRLSRGRERLRRRLAQSVLAPHASLLAPPFVPEGPALPLPVSLVNSTVGYVAAARAGRIAVAAIMRRSVATLTEATMGSLYIARITLAAALLATAAVVTLLALPAMRGLLPISQAKFTAKGKPGKPEKPRPAEARRLSAADLEEALYRVLKRDHMFNDPDWFFVIEVGDVQEKTVINATFKHRVQGKVNEYDTVVQAKRAVLHVDLDTKNMHVAVEEPEIQRLVRDADVLFLIRANVLEIPIPAASRLGAGDAVLPTAK